MGLSRRMAWTASRVSLGVDAAGGIVGEVRMMALVLSVMAAFSSSGTIWKWLCSVGRGDGHTALQLDQRLIQAEGRGGMMTSSPGFRMVEKEANSASVAPTVRMISLGA